MTMATRSHSLGVSRAAPGGGFTLIEMLVVMAIIAVLAGTLIIGLPSMMRAGDVTAMKTYITALATQIEAYEKRLQNGDYPPTSLEDAFPGIGSHFTRENCGIESVVVCLNRRGAAEAYTFEDSESVALENLDQDRSLKLLTNFETRDLFEVVDVWGTPLAYFHSRDYGSASGRGIDRVTGFEGETLRVKPWKNKKTKQFFNSRTFQIICAGPDQQFNTDDDITNFDR